MKHYIKYQVAGLLKAAEEIERGVDILAQKIIHEHIDYATATVMRDELFSIIDKTKEVYKSLFAFRVSYPEQQNLDLLKIYINSWFEHEYDEDEQND
jgi:hypothetical protein